jgi:hypothetical protein
VKKLILGICFTLALACAPELRGGKGERCDGLDACGEGFECYRGFCVADESVGEPAPIVEEGDTDPGQGSSGAADAGDTSARPVRTDTSSNTTPDAGSAPGTADDTDPPASKPASPPAVTTPPATTSEPGGRSASPNGGQAAPPPEKKPAPSTPPATMPATQDAGVRVDAAAGASADAAVLVDAGVTVRADAALPMPTLPKNCTVQDCCDEAMRQRGGDSEGRGGKECGCSDPALVPALIGTLTCTVGGVVGGLL